MNRLEKALVAGLVIDLLFAPSGIESEIVRDAQLLRISAEVSIHVASIEHLLALEVLSMDDRLRPRVRADFLALRAGATPDQLAACRASLALIEQRGHARGKALDIAASRPR